MRYLVYGYYGYGNFGDDLLLQGVIEGIRGRDRDARFVVHSFGSVAAYAADVSVCFTRVARHLFGLRKRPWRLFVYLAALARIIRGCDIFVIGGGTLFIDKGRINVALVLLALGVAYARLLGRRVVILGVAIDRLAHPVSLWATHRIFSAAQFVAVRDALSLPYLAYLPSSQVTIASDLVLGLDLSIPSSAKPRSRPVVGLCFIDYFRTVEPSEAKHKAYTDAICRLIDRHGDGCDFVTVSFQRGIGQRDDWLVAALPSRNVAIRHLHVDSMEVARSMAAEIDAVVTTRFHLGLLAAAWGKLPIVIDHELKMAALAEDLALPSITLDEFIAGRDLDPMAYLRAHDFQRTAALIAVQRERVPLNFAWLKASAVPAEVRCE